MVPEDGGLAGDCDARKGNLYKAMVRFYIMILQRRSRVIAGRVVLESRDGDSI